MATLAQFRTRISSKLGLDNTASSAEQSLIDDWVNEGVTDVLEKTHCKVTSATMALTADENDYTLDTAILRTIDVYVTSGTQGYGMTRTTPAEILRMRRADTTVGSPSRYYAVAGSNLLMVYPTPAAADVVTIYYVPRPTVLSASGDTPSEIPSEWHKAVELYALWQGADYDDDSSSGMGQLYQAQYEKYLRDIRKSIVWKGGSRLAPAIPNPRRSRGIVTHPSQDIW